MSEKTETSPGEAATGIGILVAIVCAVAAFAQGGGWGGAAIAGAMAFGGVKLLFLTFV